MKTTLLSVAIALALGLAGCDRNNPAPKQPTSSAPAPSSTAGSSAAPNAPTSNTPTTPANMRQPEQRKDFEHKGDGAGPKPGG
jgi:PBP1b-binding outer membrane lipoprotein LpoB